MRLEPIQDTPTVPASPAVEGGRTRQAPAHPAQVRLGLSQILAFGVWFGLLTGLGELAAAAYRLYRQGEVVPALPEKLWMAPLAGVLLLAIPGLVLTVATWRRPRFGSFPLVTSVYSAAAAVCLLHHLRGMEEFARILLALGVGALAGRLVVRFPGLLTGPIRWTTGWARLFSIGRRLPAPAPEAGGSGVNAVSRREVLVGSTAALAGLAAGVHAWQWFKERRALAALPGADPGRPNVLFIVLDTVRAQSLSLYGYDRPTTPSLQRLAKHGVCFDRAMAPAPWTLPSHAMMFTGRSLRETAVGIMAPYKAPYATLAEVLSARGYQTAGFVANTDFLCPAYGLHRGFSHYEAYGRSLGQVIQASALGQKLGTDYAVLQYLGYHQLLGRRTAPGITGGFLNWLEGKSPERPYFAFLNYLDCHSPYIPESEAAGKFAPRPPANPAVSRAVDYSAEEVVALRNAYDECILGLDREVGGLIDCLKAQGHLENTLVVITSDHGEHFGEHGLMEHVNDLYLQLLHVPLVLLHPSGVPGGERILPPVSLRDLPMTVLDLIGYGREAAFPGKSLARLWEKSGAPRGDEDLPVVSEVNRAEPWVPARYPATRGPMKSLVWRDYHYIRNGDQREELYHVTDDPQEENNLVGSAGARAVLERLRTSLDAGEAS
jgi:arylsulfatase A-like enzyme